MIIRPKREQLKDKNVRLPGCCLGLVAVECLSQIPRLCLQGFEPRGTYIGVRLSSLSKLQENTGPGKAMTAVPQQLSGRSAVSVCIIDV